MNESHMLSPWEKTPQNRGGGVVGGTDTFVFIAFSPNKYTSEYRNIWPSFFGPIYTLIGFFFNSIKKSSNNYNILFKKKAVSWISILITLVGWITLLKF